MANVTIDNGDSATDEILLIGKNPVSQSHKILAKLSAAGWDAAKLTISVTADGTNWFPIAVAGTPIGATPTALVFDTFEIPSWVSSFKFASVNATTGAAVNQTADRVIVWRAE